MQMLEIYCIDKIIFPWAHVTNLMSTYIHLKESESEYKRQLLYLSYIHIDIWVHVYTIHDEWLNA